MVNIPAVAHCNKTTPTVNFENFCPSREKVADIVVIISGIALGIFSVAAHIYGLPFVAVLETGIISFGLLAISVLKIVERKTKSENKPIAIPTKTAPKLTTYDQMPNKEEFNNISLIATSLGSQSVLTLPFSRNTLREARRQTGNIHPLRWLSTAMTDENLKGEMKKLYERRLRFDQRIVWGEFFDDYSKTFNRQLDKNNFVCYLDKFAADLKLDGKMLHKIVAEKRWEDFFKVVFETLNTNPC